MSRSEPVPSKRHERIQNRRRSRRREEVRGQYPTARRSTKSGKQVLDRKAPHILCSKCESSFEFDEEFGQFSLPVRLGLLEHALQMDAHSRKPDTQLVGHKLQAMAFQHKKSDAGLGLCQIEDVAEVVWLQLRLTSVVDY
jgi:hypothetical protein